MIVNPRKKCDQCSELGLWGASAAGARRCDAHRAAGDTNLVEGRCASCGLESILDTNQACQLCGEFGGIKRTYLVKQKRAKEVIEAAHTIESYDKMVDGGLCSRKRPDFVIDGLHRKIVVEVDEHQHQRGRKYSPECEETRMWDIAQALGMPTTFIRYNPDGYKGADGKWADPCLQTREEALLAWIKTLKERPGPEGSYVTALYLYYNGHTTQEAAEEVVLADPLEAFEAPTAEEPAPVAANLSNEDYDTQLAIYEF